MITPSPSTVGSTATRTSNKTPAGLRTNRDTAVLRHAVSAMSSFASTLTRLITPGASSWGFAPPRGESRRRGAARRAVARAEESGRRSRPARRLQDHRVDELDRRGLRKAVRGLQVDDVVVAGLRIGTWRPSMWAGFRLLPARQPVQLRVDVRGGGNTEVDRVGADEAELVGELDVGRIDDGDLQPTVFDPVRKRGDPVRTSSAIDSAATVSTRSEPSTITGSWYCSASARRPSGPSMVPSVACGVKDMSR